MCCLCTATNPVDTIEYCTVQYQRESIQLESSRHHAMHTTTRSGTLNHRAAFVSAFSIVRSRRESAVAIAVAAGQEDFHPADLFLHVVSPRLARRSFAKAGTVQYSTSTAQQGSLAAQQLSSSGTA